jgi:hypothetical protein
MTCPLLGRWIGGCRFEPRYQPAVTISDVVGCPKGATSVEGTISVEMLRPRTYLYDVCIRCGKIARADAEKEKGERE